MFLSLEVIFGLFYTIDSASCHTQHPRNHLPSKKKKDRIDLGSLVALCSSPFDLPGMNRDQAREALQTFKELFEDGIITQTEYDQKRQDALAMLTNGIGGMKRGAASPAAAAAPAAAPASPTPSYQRPNVTREQSSALQANIDAARGSGGIAAAPAGARATVTLEAQLAAILDSDDFADTVSTNAASSAAPAAAVAAAPAPVVDPEAEEKELASAIGYKRRKCVATLADHKNYVFSIAVIGSNLYSGSGDNTVKLWDLQNLQCAHTFEGHSAAVSCLEVAGKTLFSGSWDNTIKVWDTRSNKCAKTLSTHTNYVSSLFFDGNNLWSGSWDCSIVCWDIRTWQAKHSIMKAGHSGGGGVPSFGHGGPVSALALGPGGVLLSGSHDKTIKAFDRRTGDCKKTVEAHDNWIFGLKTSGDEDDMRVWTASRDKTIKIWNPQNNWACQATLSDHEDNVTDLALDKSVMYSSSMDKTIKARDLNTGKVCQTMTGHSANVVSLLCAYSTLYSGSWDKTVKIWQ
jgi:WD40 repeat protein